MSVMIAFWLLLLRHNESIKLFNDGPINYKDLKNISTIRMPGC